MLDGDGERELDAPVPDEGAVRKDGASPAA